MPDGNPWDGEVPPKIPFNSDVTECVLDIKGICSIPFDTDAEGVCSFRVLMMPKGKTMAIPNVHGCYIVDGDFTNQVALVIVHFNDNTHRLPELLCYFMDHGMANRDQSGLSVVSLKLPLLIRKGSYESDTKVAPMSDVSGFTPINVAQLPWSAHLEPALAKIEIFKFLKINKPSTMVNWVAKPVASRIDAILSIATSALDARVAAVTRQDASQASRVRATAMAKINTIIDTIRARASAYDEQLSTRIIRLCDARLGPTALNISPVRAAFATEQPRLLRSRLLAASPREIEAIPPPNSVARYATAVHGENSSSGSESSNDHVRPFRKRGRKHRRNRLVDDPSSDDSDVVEQFNDNSSLGKRARQPPARLDADTPAVRKPAAKKKENPVKTPAIADGLNRAGQPWVRGPYGKRDRVAETVPNKVKKDANKAALKAAAKEARRLAATPSFVANATIELLQAQVATLSSENASLTATNVSLTFQIKIQKDGEAMKIRNAVLEDQVKSCSKMMQQFIKGVALGQNTASNTIGSASSSMTHPLMTPMPGMPGFRLNMDE